MKANKDLGINLALLKEAHQAGLSLKRGIPGANVMYFETGQGGQRFPATYISALIIGPQGDCSLQTVTMSECGYRWLRVRVTTTFHDPIRLFTRRCGYPDRPKPGSWPEKR
jgi:hypothetical protein